MQRNVDIASAGLSLLTIALAAITLWATAFLESRAIWSGVESPPEWTAKAGATDRFDIAGHPVAYWGKPDAVYSRYATRSRRKPIAVVVHHTRAAPVENLVRYGHVSDPNRGGAAFGYHFYVGRDGNIIQGAPLSRRTNHIKFMNHKKRRATARHLWSGNTIGVTLVGGCDPLMRPVWSRLSDRWACSDEFITQEQLKAGLAVVRALQSAYGMACEAVYGHGDLQVDRARFEGERLSRLARRVCKIEESEDAEKLPAAEAGVAVQAAKGAGANGS